MLPPQTNIELALTIDADPADSRRCRQTLEGQVSVAVYGLGRMAEEAICESLRLQYFFLPQVVERCASAPDVRAHAHLSNCRVLRVHVSPAVWPVPLAAGPGFHVGPVQHALAAWVFRRFLLDRNV